MEHGEKEIDPARDDSCGGPKPFRRATTNSLLSLKERIRNAQLRAALSVNRELVLLYWELGPRHSGPST